MKVAASGVTAVRVAAWPTLPAGRRAQGVFMAVPTRLPFARSSSPKLVPGAACSAAVLFIRGFPRWPHRSGHCWSADRSCGCSIAQSCPTLCDPLDCSAPGLPVHHQLPELAQTHVHRVSDAIQPSHPLSSPSPPAFNLSQHQGLSK